MCKPLDILVVVKGAGVANLNFAPDEPACIGRQLMAVRATPELADPNYIYFALAATQQSLKEKAMGATVPGLSIEHLENLTIPICSLLEQCRIAIKLRRQFTELHQAKSAIQQQIQATADLVESLLRHSLASATETPLGLCLREVTKGIGEDWSRYPVLGAARAGLSPAKEPVGKTPQRYKPVRLGSIFYNPMRILLGSIAMVDEGDPEGITSPDYVVMTGIESKLHPRWFYHWFRSRLGAELIRSVSRGAVRERLLFKRLAPVVIRIPDWSMQQRVADQLLEIRNFRTRLTQKAETLETVMPGLLREVFKGLPESGVDSGVRPTVSATVLQP
jgi:type I restriction enzyme S subunit